MMKEKGLSNELVIWLTFKHKSYNAWRSYQKNFIEKNENGKIVELDCSHYVHDHEYETISEKMKEFLLDL